MTQSIRELEAQLRTKESELDSIGNKLAGAGIGAAVTQGSLLGTAAGALMGRGREKKNKIEREIEELERKIKGNKDEVSRLHTKKSQLQNQFQSDKARFEADMRQQRTDLERQKQNEQDPDKVRALNDQLSRFQSDITTQQQQNHRAHEQELQRIQQEINALTL